MHQNKSVLVDKDIYQEFENLMREAGCYFVNPEEKQKLQNSMFEYTEEYGYKLKSTCTRSKSPYTIAKEAGFEVPEDTKVIVVYEEWNWKGISIFKRKTKPSLNILHC